jgi:outer membrane beta-barrel protein
MKNKMRRIRLTTLFASLLLVTSAGANNLKNEISALGADGDILKRVKALSPRNRIRVVQKRSVDRNLRFEFGGGFGAISGGDPFLSTKVLLGRADFHLTPRYSLGVQYSSFDNDLNSEGKNRAELAKKYPNNDNLIPKTDHAISSTMAIFNWYPMYGKVNILDSAITQFDVYFLLGAGNISLQSGDTSVATVGGGLAFWISQHISTRLEVRYQTYEDRPEIQQRQLDQTVLSANIGFLL